MNLKNIWYAEDFRKWIFDKKEELQDIDIEKISVNQNKIKLWKNQNIDLWWIVKWYAVDLVSEYLKEKWYIDFIINAWGDIFISWKNKNGDVPVVAIDSPFNKKKILAVLEVTNKAISTSWTYKRKWNVENENFHHILNPKTNSNNNEIISISLVSDKCYIADAYATACIAMWIEKSLVFLKKQNIDWIIIWTDGNTYETKWLKDYNLEII
jgi:thiamine biosynthesis lipoprotein